MVNRTVLAIGVILAVVGGLSLVLGYIAIVGTPMQAYLVPFVLVTCGLPGIVLGVLVALLGLLTRRKT